MEIYLAIIAVGVICIVIKLFSLTKEVPFLLKSVHGTDAYRGGVGQKEIAREAYYRSYQDKSLKTTLNPVFDEASMVWEKVLEGETQEEIDRWMGVRFKELYKDILEHCKAGKAPESFQIGHTVSEAMRELTKLPRQRDKYATSFEKMLEANLLVFRGDLSLREAMEKYEGEIKREGDPWTLNTKEMKKEYEEYKDSTREEIIREWKTWVERAEEMEKQEVAGRE